MMYQHPNSLVIECLQYMQKLYFLFFNLIHLCAKKKQHSWGRDWNIRFKSSGWRNWDTLKKRSQRRELMTLFDNLKGGCREEGVHLFFQVTSDGRQRNGLKLQQETFRLHNRKGFFTEKGDQAV